MAPVDDVDATQVVATDPTGIANFLSIIHVRSIRTVLEMFGNGRLQARLFGL
jgi:hypothetical protein